MSDQQTKSSDARDMLSEIDAVLDRIRPMVQADGGNVELVDFDEIDGVVMIRLVGACVGCPSSTVTLQMGIEETLKEEVPGVKRVEAVV